MPVIVLKLFDYKTRHFEFSVRKRKFKSHNDDFLFQAAWKQTLNFSFNKPSNLMQG